jgi:exodeoxyribonuclease VII large subunit
LTLPKKVYKLEPVKSKLMPEVINDKQIFSLQEVSLSIQKTLTERYTSSFWVKAEMNKLNHYASSGHCYPDLVERKNGKVTAQMRATLWKSDYIEIQNKFLRVTKEPLKDGIQILLCARITFDPTHGLALNILDIDPSYSLGELELEKQATIDRLKTEGIFNKNKELKFPFLPKRIAVISVQSSKGYSDFIQKTEPNPWGYRLFHLLFSSLLQGDKAVQDIIGQLNRIKRVLHHFDAVAIIRGGGGDVGLTCYNHYSLCKELTNFPLPVLTGIGHSTNETVAEMIAYKNCITPTDLADFLMQQFHNVSVPLQEMQEKLTHRSQMQLKECTATLEHNGKYFQSVTKRSLLESTSAVIHCSNMIEVHTRHIIGNQADNFASTEHSLIRNIKVLLKDKNDRLENTLPLLQKEVMLHLSEFKNRATQLRDALSKDSKIIFARLAPQISFCKVRLQGCVQRAFTENSREMQVIEQRVHVGDPMNLLKRGYTITLVNNKAIKSSKDVKEGDLITTITTDGSVISTATTKP